MTKEKARPLSKVQLDVIKSLIITKTHKLKEAYTQRRQQQFTLDNEAYELASKGYWEKRNAAELREVTRRPSTYICGGTIGCKVQINGDKINEWAVAKFGEAPERPKHPSVDNVDVEFPCFASGNHGYYGATISVPKPYKEAYEALSQKISVAVLNGQCEGIVEAIATLGDP